MPPTYVPRAFNSERIKSWPITVETSLFLFIVCMSMLGLDVNARVVGGTIDRRNDFITICDALDAWGLAGARSIEQGLFPSAIKQYELDDLCGWGPGSPEANKVDERDEKVAG